VVLGQNGFLPSRLIGIRPYWDAEGINDLRDSYGAEWTYSQRKRLELACQAAFFVGIVLCQIGNLLICRTKRESLFKHGFRNYQMYIAELITFAFVCFLLYVPGLNTALGVYPLKFLWWLPSLPFFVYIIIYAEIIKLLCRKYPKTWFKETFTF
jgi:sodium/potassium-transporting ATPase subunit alpha